MQWGHRLGGGRVKRSRIACRTAGRLGCGGDPPIVFFPSRGLEAAGLEEGVGDHGHQGVPVQSDPRSAFEVVEAEFFLQLLMRLLADPSGFDRSGERLEARIGWQVRHIVFWLAGRPPFADEPDFVARHAWHAIIKPAVLMTVCDANAANCEGACQPALCAPPPIDPSPFLVSQHRLSGDGRLIRDAGLARPSGLGDGKDQSDVGGIDILAPRQPDRPLETALAQSLTERPAGALSRTGEDATEARARGDDAVNLLDCDFRLRQCVPSFLWHASPRHALGIACPVFEEEQPQANHHRDLARRQRQRDQRLTIGRLSERRGVLRRDADRMLALFSATPVSSTISHASRPPTILSASASKAFSIRAASHTPLAMK